LRSFIFINRKEEKQTSEEEKEKARLLKTK